MPATISPYEPGFSACTFSLNLSAQQIAAELDLNKDNLAASGRANCVRASWRKNLKSSSQARLNDELYLIAGFKDQQDQVKKGAQRSLDAVENAGGERKSLYFRHDSTR